jgi:fructose-1,6-bisphosphatase/sedoheptulose 1,7-bisphosphatase-like protein
MTVVMLDRPRHEQAMREVREAGARIRLILDGDVSASLLAVSDRSPVDGAATESLVMRSRSGTVRRIHARHDRTKLRAVTGERYG